MVINKSFQKYRITKGFQDLQTDYDYMQELLSDLNEKPEIIELQNKKQNLLRDNSENTRNTIEKRGIIQRQEIETYPKIIFKNYEITIRKRRENSK